MRSSEKDDAGPDIAEEHPGDERHDDAEHRDTDATTPGPESERAPGPLAGLGRDDISAGGVIPRFCRILLDLVMLGLTVAIVYAYFVQDVNRAARDTVALAAAGLFIVLLLAVALWMVYRGQPKHLLGVSAPGELFHYGETSGKQPVLNIEVDRPFVQYRPTAIRLRIRNISDSEGIRVRFHSMDHVSPSSIDLPLRPGEEDEIEVQLVPVTLGERELSIEFAELFDRDGRLIPRFEAKVISVERFRYVAREPAFGGITASQVRALKTVASVAMALIVGSGVIVAFFGEALGGFEQIVRTYIPMLVLLQVPVFYLYYALRNRLPTGL